MKINVIHWAKINSGSKEITLLLKQKLDTTYTFLKTEKVIVDWLISMAKIKDELLISQEVLPCKVWTMNYMSDTVLGTEDKTMNRNKVDALIEFIYLQVKGEATNKYILAQVVTNLGATSMQMLSDIPCLERTS